MTAFGQSSSDNKIKKEEAHFKLYPNPATEDVVYITTEKSGTKDIIIYDVFGEIVLKARIKSTVLDISELIVGIYVIQVTEDNITMTRKLVVK